VTEASSLSNPPLILDHSGTAVIIAAYNAAETIERAILSALAEPEVLEVFVIDDASSDETSLIASACNDHSNRLTVITLSQNGGPSIARNIGLEMAKSPWITILDADDFFLPGRIGRLLAISTDADFVADDLWQAREGESNFKSTLLDHTVTQNEVISFSKFVSGNLTSKHKQRGELGFIKPLIRRAFLGKHGIKYKENMRLGEDYELYARSLAHGAKFILTPPKGYVSLWRNDSLSGRHTELDLLNLREADLHIMEIPSLSKAERKAVRNHYISVDCRLQWRLAINAVKSRSPQKFFGTFIRPWPVPVYVLGQLINQVWVRALGRD
jgi:succinoglycan biosynthesis protein ExoU